jgi:aminoglycoside phosphotransferase (APT) family kinase protein
MGLMNTQLSLPPPVAAIIATAFPGAAITDLSPTVGGFSNLAVAARIGGARCVIKAAELPAKREDLRREQLVLGLLGGRRLGAPTPLAFAERCGWAVLVMRRRPGVPGITLYGGAPEALAPAYTRLGRTLARLHSLGLAPPPAAAGERLLIAERAAALAASLADLPLPDVLRAPLAAALEHPAWQPARPRLVHGDAGLHNVLWGPSGLTLLDWELAGWGDPRLDLAWVAWTMRFRGLPTTHGGALLAGYGRERAAALGLEEAALRALALGQVAALLARAAGRAGAWEEWLRRARWTLHLNQIASG